MISYRCSCGFLKNKTLDQGQVCPRCHVPCVDNISRIKTFGKIKLVTPVFKTTKKNEIIKIIGKGFKQLLDPRQADANAALSRYICLSIDKEHIALVNHPAEVPEHHIMIPFRIGGIFSLIYVFKFLADIVQVGFIQELFEKKVIIDEVEVLPPDVRPVFKDPQNPNVLRYEEINRFYISLINSNRRNRLFNPTLNDEIKIWTERLFEKLKNQDFTDLDDVSSIVEYDQISAFYQVYVDNIYDWCFKHIRGKEGLVRSTILSRTLEFSGRTVVVVDPDTKPYQVKVPREMLFTLWSPYFLNYLTSNGLMRFDDCYNRVAEKKYFEIVKDKEVHGYFLKFLDWFTKSEDAKRF